MSGRGDRHADFSDMSNEESATDGVLKHSFPESISIIIPTLNEAATLAALIAATAAAADTEFIVVDGGSQDQTVEVARRAGWKVLFSPPGRARQMNTGAAAASGEILLFLHADTRLPQGFDTHARSILSRPGVVAGAFQLQIAAAKFGLRVIEKLANWRARRLQMPYGDQAIFLRANRFRAVGGFPDMPIMEDFELVRRLRKQGRVEIAPVPAATSGRRWEELGPWRTAFINQVCILAYYLGVKPSRIARWYYK